MIGPELGRAGLRIGFVIGIPAAIMLFLIPPGTAEFAITLLTFIIAALFTCGLMLFVWFSSR